jgi:hypothetical protein
MRTLYFAKLGTCCVGWWDAEPPNVVEVGGRRNCPRFQPPDIYHDHTVGNDEEVIADFCRAGVLPPIDTFRIVQIQQEWVAAGLQRVAETRAKRKRVLVNPEVDGLFRPRDVRPVGRNGEMYE